MPVINGNGHTTEKAKGVYVTGASTKHGKAGVNGAGRTKRKIGAYFSELPIGIFFVLRRDILTWRCLCFHIR